MTSLAASPPKAPEPNASPRTDYRAGACNIGPREIARRRRSGLVGMVLAVALLGGLLLVHAPPVTRLLVAAPAALAAAGYLQAHLRFCAGFGALGIANFGVAEDRQAIVDPRSRAADRRRALQISGTSFLIGLVVGGSAALLPF